ncbi:hypothetical protein I6E68_12695 [Salinibacterium sp. NSLL150]|uniref:hypothetical protein n=1 Tax=unclassified Salinibacterium TaxID=2632331 RepID=UPI0018CE243C|nr:MULTISPECIES: hypothetical protein [unclassified Salinibacterium]MBH0099992.1 hypothetical protein [Salinibacterium sp. NSLL35]MBH0102746.1 hypothetical protein [Salinibacterium sp. NSLL150]MBH0105506.1 hypothetical protein [Salinibacterium sp. NSLL16]MBH0108266.1 hypothetical protein [Salinibacterium sp. NSLL17]MBH0117190.1 hypothetical protein [Salinibacterium sp. NG253]
MKSVIVLLASTSLLGSCVGVPANEIGADLEVKALERTAFLFADASACIQIQAEEEAPIEDVELFESKLDQCGFSLQILDLTDEEILSEFRPAGDGTWLVSGHTAEQRLTLTAYTTGLARFDSGLVAARHIRSLCWSLSLDIQTGSDVNITDETCSPAIFLVDSEYILTNIAELEAAT